MPEQEHVSAFHFSVKCFSNISVSSVFDCLDCISFLIKQKFVATVKSITLMQSSVISSNVVSISGFCSL